jgi:predicted CopG family antitoxin
MKAIKKFKELNDKHVVISEPNYYKLKSLGKMGDTFDKVLGELLSKNEMLESNFGVKAREKTPTISTP